MPERRARKRETPAALGGNGDPERAFAFCQQVFGAVAVYRERGFIQAQTPGAWDVLVFEAQPDNMPPDVLRLMSLFPQPVRRQPSVEFLPVPRRRADQAAGGVALAMILSMIIMFFVPDL